ncbi:hypothetical protein C2845_PM01G09990 [Panicum miliaceum]|uniref:J domain-containing protein n=1 Tax=Panicum miliaceum TaxID=4540 RepID=A0A3L6TQ81_PANMI|nr:hypothetical protein C2845_PM01G09990 [Panicum miliaceum]
MGSSEADEDQLLKSFLAEVSETERDNEVLRILGCFKLNPFEHLKLSFDSSPDEVKKQYRKLSLLVHPDKCKHPQAQEAFAALAKAQQLLLDPQERGYILGQVTAAKEELRAKRKKELKKDSASKIKSLVDEGKYEEQFERSDEFQQQLIIKVREILTEKEWRRKKMQMRISEEEGRLKKDEEETKEMWKRKREHEEKWEETRDQRVSSWRDFMKTGKKGRKGEIKPPKLKTEDPNKSYVQRPVVDHLMPRLMVLNIVGGMFEKGHVRVSRATSKWAFDLAAFPFPTSALSKDGGPGGDVAGTRARSWTHGITQAEFQHESHYGMSPT